MASLLFRDDNGKPIAGPEGMRPDFATAIRANTGAVITEMSLATMNLAANRNQNGDVMLRVVNQGSNSCYFSLGAAGAAPATNADMVVILTNSVAHFRALSTDASCYHQQITGATSLEVSALV